VTVGELIAVLSNFDPSLRVLAQDYEDGFSDPRISQSKMYREYDKGTCPWFYGPYDEANDDSDYYRKKFEGRERFDAVLIWRTGGDE